MSNTLTYCLIIFMLLSSSFSYSQQNNALIDSAGVLYDYENFDEAIALYERAFIENADYKNIQIEALAGLIKTYTFKVNLPKADSIYDNGIDLLANTPLIAIPTKLRFNQAAGELFRKQGRFDEALNLHKEVLKGCKNVKDNNVLCAYANLFTGATFEQISANDSALFYVQTAFDLFSDLYPENHVKFTTVYNLLGSCYYRLSDFENASKFYLKAIENAKLNIEGPSFFLPMAYGNLAVVTNNLGHHEEAIKYIERSLAINKTLDEPDGIGFNYYSLAVTYFFLGDYGRSADYANACINIRKQIYEPNHYRLAGPTELLGIVYEESGDFKNAIAYLKKAKQIKIQNLGKGSIEEAYSNENIAICNLKLGELDSANHYINLANKVIPLKTSKNQYSLATHYYTLSNIKLAYKKYDEALDAIHNSTKIFKALKLTDSEEFAQNLAIEATIYSEQNEFDKAQQILEQSLDILQLNKDSILQDAPFVISEITLSIVNTIIDHSFNAYQKTKDEFYLKQTNDYSKVFLKISDNYRKQFNDPFTKSAIALKNNEGVELGFSINYQIYNNHPTPIIEEEVFKYAEIGRTTLFRDLIDDYKVKSFAGISPELLKEEEEFKSKIADLNQQLVETPNDSTLKNELFVTKEAFNKHIERYHVEHPNYYNLKFKNEAISIENIKNDVLKKGENLIEYVTDDTAYYAIVINKETTFIKHLASKKMINSTIELWRKSINRIDFEANHRTGYLLYSNLIKPIEENITGKALIIIPTSALFYLNFEALNKEKNTTKYLIEDYNIHYALSATVLYEQMKSKSKSKGAPMVIAPGFEENLKNNYEASIELSGDIDETYMNTVRQPWSLKLANYMARKYKGNALTGDVASETNVKSSLNNNPIIHFATHAIADENDPLRSRFILAKDANSNENDGYLHTYEIYNLNLNTELAVLTACESGIGNIQKGEGMISLAYSMNYAGCPSVIMSLWKIDEKTNASITSSFYKYLSKGKDFSTALRNSKLDYLKNSEGVLAHPFYWSGLVLMGKNSTIELQSNYMNWKIVIPIILLFIGLVFLARKMRSKS